MDAEFVATKELRLHRCCKGANWSKLTRAIASEEGAQPAIAYLEVLQKYQRNQNENSYLSREDLLRTLLRQSGSSRSRKERKMSI